MLHFPAQKWESDLVVVICTGGWERLKKGKSYKNKKTWILAELLVFIYVARVLRLSLGEYVASWKLMLFWKFHICWIGETETQFHHLPLYINKHFDSLALSWRFADDQYISVWMFLKGSSFAVKNHYCISIGLLLEMEYFFFFRSFAGSTSESTVISYNFFSDLWI